MTTFIIALEGSPLAGKSSLARRILQRWPSVWYFPDYVEMLDRIDIPPFDPGSSVAQDEAFQRFMSAEAARYSIVARNQPNIVLLDRSVDTFLAHAYALDDMRGYGTYPLIFNQLRSRNHLVPDVTFYMRAASQTLQARLLIRDQDDSCAPFIDQKFRGLCDKFFESDLSQAKQLHWLCSESVEDIIPYQICAIIEPRM